MIRGFLVGMLPLRGDRRKEFKWGARRRSPLPRIISDFLGSATSPPGGPALWCRSDRSARPAGQQPTMPSVAPVGVPPPAGTWRSRPFHPFGGISGGSIMMAATLLQLLSKCWTIHLYYATFSTEGQPLTLLYYHGVSEPNGVASIAPRRDGSPSRPSVVRTVAARGFPAAGNPARSGQSSLPSTSIWPNPT